MAGTLAGAWLPLYPKVQQNQGHCHPGVVQDTHWHLGPLLIGLPLQMLPPISRAGVGDSRGTGTLFCLEQLCLWPFPSQSFCLAGTRPVTISPMRSSEMKNPFLGSTGFPGVDASL